MVQVENNYLESNAAKGVGQLNYLMDDVGITNNQFTNAWKQIVLVSLLIQIKIRNRIC